MMAPSIETRLAATDLVTRYFDLVDRGLASGTADLFASGGTLTFGPGAPNPGTIAGDAIRAAMTARQAQTHVTTRHVLTNVIVAGQDDGSLIVRSLLTLFRSDDETRSTAIASVADIEDHLVTEAGEWRILSRLISPVFNRT